MDTLWVGMAFVYGMLFSRIKLPPIAGYLAAGGYFRLMVMKPGPKLAAVSLSDETDPGNEVLDPYFVTL